MENIIPLVQGDFGNHIDAVIYREDQATPEDLRGTTTFLHFRKTGKFLTLFSLRNQSVEDELEVGKLRFTFEEGQLELPAGYYEGQIEVVHQQKESVYEVTQFYLRGRF